MCVCVCVCVFVCVCVYVCYVGNLSRPNVIVSLALMKILIENPMPGCGFYRIYILYLMSLELG